MTSKKRKPDTDSLTLEAERSLHQSFVHAANAVSQLYTHALTHQHKRAHVDGARQVLWSKLEEARFTAAQERQVNWVVREYGNSPSIPTTVLLSYLRQELQLLYLVTKEMAGVLQGVDMAEMQGPASVPAPGFGYAEHPHAERHFASAAARRPGSLDGAAPCQPGVYFPFGQTHLPPGGR